MKSRRDLGDDLGNRADRRGEKHHICIFNPFFEVVFITVDNAELHSPLQIGSPPADTDNFSDLAFFAEHTGKRAADKADTDNGKTVYQWHIIWPSGTTPTV